MLPLFCIYTATDPSLTHGEVANLKMNCSREEAKSEELANLKFKAAAEAKLMTQMAS